MERWVLHLPAQVIAAGSVQQHDRVRATPAPVGEDAHPGAGGDQPLCVRLVVIARLQGGAAPLLAHRLEQLLARQRGVLEASPALAQRVGDGLRPVMVDRGDQ